MRAATTATGSVAERMAPLRRGLGCWDYGFVLFFEGLGLLGFLFEVWGLEFRASDVALLVGGVLAFGLRVLEALVRTSLISCTGDLGELNQKWPRENMSHTPQTEHFQNHCPSQTK